MDRGVYRRLGETEKGGKRVRGAREDNHLPEGDLHEILPTPGEHRALILRYQISTGYQISCGNPQARPVTHDCFLHWVLWWKIDYSLLINLCYTEFAKFGNILRSHEVQQPDRECSSYSVAAISPFSVSTVLGILRGSLVEGIWFNSSVYFALSACSSIFTLLAGRGYLW